MEVSLLKMDADIKSSLCLDRADAQKCLDAMETISTLAIDSLMLKKHPQVMETVKRVKRFRTRG